MATNERFASARDGYMANTSTYSSPKDSDTSIIRAAEDMLEQAESLLQFVSDSEFATPVEAAHGASIGAHLRHCLDHFTSFLAGTAESRINYDHRERDLELEQNRTVALNRIREIRESVSRLNTATLARPVNVTSKVLNHGAFAQEAASSFARELMYVVAHTLHHFALIRVMGSLLNAELPQEFGVAPSTLQHRQAMAVAAGRAET